MAENGQDSDFQDFIGSMESRNFDNRVINKEVQRLNETIKSQNVLKSQKQSGHLCKTCGQRFSKSYTLKRHVLNRVCTKKLFCKHCGKTFSKEKYLKKHEDGRKCDRGKRLLQSNTKSVPSSSAVTEQNVLMPADKSKKFQCQKCKALFTRKFNLKRHAERNTCTSNGIDRVFTCKTCQKQFSSTAYLIKHMKTHSAGPKNKERQISQEAGPSHRQEQPAQNQIFDDTPPQDQIGAPSPSQANNDNDDDGMVSDIDSEASFDDENLANVDDDPLRPQNRLANFDGILVRYFMPAIDAERTDLMYLLSNRRDQVRSNLIRELRRLRMIKWYSVIKVRMDRRDMSGDIVDTAMPVFRSRTVTVLEPEVLDGQINEAYLKMIRSLDSFKESGSGWTLGEVIHMELTIAKYNPLRGACYQYNIPGTLLRKQCILNVTGPPALDGECFRYAVLASLYTDVQHTGNLPWSELHEYRNKLSFKGIDGSGRHMPISCVPEFERLNTMSVNIYGFENDKVFPVFISKAYCPEKHVNLLLLEGKKSSDIDKYDVHSINEIENYETIANNRSPHYCVVKDMGRLLYSQVGGTHPVHICMKCLTVTSTAERLEKHKELCSVNEENVRYYMPTDKEKWFKFRNHGRKMKVSFVIFASFGWYTSKILGDDEPTTGFQVRERKLDCCAYSYHRISIDNSYPTEVQYYRGASPEDTMNHFLQAMKKEEEEVFEILKTVAPMELDDEGMHNISESNDVCFVCNYPFLPEDRVGWDHSHVSGKIRGRIHCDSCNLRLKEANFLPVFLQNLSHTEGRLIIQSISQFGASKVRVIPQTLDTYVSITVNKCRFLDFSRFMKADLNELVECLRSKAGTGAFRNVKLHLPEDKIDVTIKRQVGFYDYLDGPERLRENSLPEREVFYDRIRNHMATPAEYSQAQQLWNAFQMTTLEDYLKHHLCLQSLLFADVAVNFRDTLMADFELDCFWYYSLPGYSLDAALHSTGVVFELLQDEEMHHTLLAGLRGGVTHVGCPRHVEANNPAMGEHYDPAKPISHLKFLDENSMYASIMADFPVPIHGFRYLESYEIDHLDIESLPKDSGNGYIFVVDLEYPETLHQKHDKFPMAPETIQIDASDLSKYTKDLAERCRIRLTEEKKLCLTLRDKKKYPVHYLTLQQYLLHGLKVKKIHSVITFTQTKALKQFVDFCCNKRRQAQNPFDNLLYKGLPNHLFGKTIENVFKRIKVKICTTPDKLQSLVKKPSFQAVRVLSENVAVVQQYQQSVRLTKPIAVGFSILGPINVSVWPLMRLCGCAASSGCMLVANVLYLSKLRMYQFFYDFLLEEFPEDSVDMIYSDTDSFLVHIKDVPNVDDIFWKHRRLFDFSNLPDGHQLKDDSNKQVPGKMKYQVSGVCMEAIILSGKCYSVLTTDESKSTAKGVTVQIKHEDYKRCIQSEIAYRDRVKSVKHFNQHMYHVCTEKTLLSPVETKRYYVNANQSYSHGHYFLGLLKDDEEFS